MRDRERPAREWTLRLAGVVLIAATLYAGLLVAVKLSLRWGGTDRAMTKEEIVGRARRDLPINPDDPEDDTTDAWIRRHVTPIHGHTRHGGFHGDGTDCYEVELSPELAQRVLRVAPPAAKPGAIALQTSHLNAAPWWPQVWPEGCRMWAEDRRWIIFSPDSRRVWTLHLQT